MTTTGWSLMILAALSGLAGIGLLYQSWKRSGRPEHLAGGWALLAGGVILAGIANGDRGIAQVTLIAMAGATAIFAIPLAKGIAPPVTTVRTRGNPAGPGKKAHPLIESLSALWAFVLTGPVAGLIALFASAVLFKLIRPADGSPATAGAIAIVAAILIWAVLSVLLLMEPRAGRRSLYAGTGLVACAAAAFI